MVLSSASDSLGADGETAPALRFQVVYDIEGFLEKNNDSLHDNLLDLLDATEDAFLRSVIECDDPGAVGKILSVDQGVARSLVSSSDRARALPSVDWM